MNINRNSKCRLLAVLAVLAMLLGPLPGSVFAQASESAQVVIPIPGPALDVYQVTVNDGAGGQTDPHLSGDWVSYTDNLANGIRFQNLDLGTVSDRLIPPPDGLYDSLSDISGGKIAFMRSSDTAQEIYLSQIDMFGNPGPAVELSPLEGALRRRTVVGGDTIAYEDRSYDRSYSAEPEISLSSAEDPGAPAYRLTNDMLADIWPAVSPDGNTVVWLKCPTASTSTLVCDVWRAERTLGTWGDPEQVTDANGAEMLPDTNGPITVYDSTVDGERKIYWSVKDSSGAYVESVLYLSGIQRNPNIAGNLIVFESSAAQGMQYELWLYDLATNRLYQLTDTEISESLSDVTISDPPGIVRVVWAQPKQIYPFDMDIYALSFFLPDLTPPSITPTVSGTLGANGWYTNDVTITWSLSDTESTISSTSGCEPVSITQDQAATDYTCSATSAGGTSSGTATIKRDGTKPVTGVTNVTEGAMYPLGSVPQAGCTTTDNLSGVATEATVALTGGDAQGVGDITATCSGALDAAGHAANPAVVHYTVNIPSNTYNFAGFFQPVDNPGLGPTYVFNSVKAGSAIPVKFSLGGNQGLNILSDAISRPANCTTAAITDPIEQTVVAGNSSLSYDAASDTYTYVWKTDKKWVGTCHVLNIKLDDGTEHLAYFQFK